MKTSLTLCVSLMLIASLTACGNNAGVADDSLSQSEVTSPSEIGRTVGEGLSDSWETLSDFGKGVWNGFKNNTDH